MTDEKRLFGVAEGYLEEVSVSLEESSQCEIGLEPTVPFRIDLGGQDAILFVLGEQLLMKQFPGLNSLIGDSKGHKELRAIVMSQTCRFGVSKVSDCIGMAMQLMSLKSTRQKVRIWLSVQDQRNVVRVDAI